MKKVIFLFVIIFFLLVLLFLGTKEQEKIPVSYRIVEDDKAIDSSINPYMLGKDLVIEYKSSVKPRVEGSVNYTVLDDRVIVYNYSKQHFRLIFGYSSDVYEFGTAIIAGNIKSFKEAWYIKVISQETDYNNDGKPDVIPYFKPINDTLLEIDVDDTRETRAYKWASAICNISGVQSIGKWEYNPKTNVWTYTGLLNYGKLSNYGMNSSWCNETGNYGFVLFSSGFGDKQFMLNFTEGEKEIIVYTGKGSSVVIASTSPFSDEWFLHSETSFDDYKAWSPSEPDNFTNITVSTSLGENFVGQWITPPLSSDSITFEAPHNWLAKIYVNNETTSEGYFYFKLYRYNGSEEEIYTSSPSEFLNVTTLQNTTQNRKFLNTTNVTGTNYLGYLWQSKDLNNHTFYNGDRLLMKLFFNATKIGNLIIGIDSNYTPSAVYDPVETRYFRSDQQTVNGLTAYKLGTTQTTTYTYVEVGYAGSSSSYYDIEIAVRHSDGTETELLAWTQFATRIATGEGLQTYNFNCPQTSLVSTDAVVVRLRARITGSSATAVFITEQLGATQLPAATWNFYIYTYLYKSKLESYADIYWGDSTYNTRVENFQWTSGVVPQVYERNLSLSIGFSTGQNKIADVRRGFASIIGLSDLFVKTNYFERTSPLSLGFSSSFSKLSEFERFIASGIGLSDVFSRAINYIRTSYLPISLASNFEKTINMERLVGISAGIEGIFERMANYGRTTNSSIGITSLFARTSIFSRFTTIGIGLSGMFERITIFPQIFERVFSTGIGFLWNIIKLPIGEDIILEDRYAPVIGAIVVLLISLAYTMLI